MAFLEKLNLNFKFHWSLFKERHAMSKEDLIFRITQIFLAEFLATMMLLFYGCSSLGGLNTGDAVVACWLWGNIVFIDIQIFGPISNCHINPAVTLSFCIYGYISVVMAIVYVIAQCLGATAGYALLMGFGTNDYIPYGFQSSKGFCVNMVNTNTLFRAVVLEAFGTAILCFMIGRVCNPLNPKGLVNISFSFSLAIMIIGYSLAPFTGASVNPARSLGPAVFTGQFQDHWIYWVGPLSGSIIASFLYHIFFLPKVKYISNDIAERSRSEISKSELSI